MKLSHFKIFGTDTFPVKDELAALGCYWCPKEKCWNTNSMLDIEVVMLMKLLEDRDVQIVQLEELAGDVTIEQFFKDLNRDFDCN